MSNEREVELPSLKDLLKEEYLPLVKGEGPRRGEVWTEDPVDFKTFVEHPDFCGHPPLTPLQLKGVMGVLGDDPKRIFDPQGGTGKQIGVLLMGKGSGKDTVAALTQIYIIYVLCCLQDPLAYLNLGPGSKIDLLNVAPVGQQAEDIFFTRFTSLLKQCGWFRERFNFVESGKVLGKKRRRGLDDIKIGTRVCEVPPCIRATSVNSNFSGWDGYNVLFWVMDEASAFKSETKIANAGAIFDTLRTSATSRFGMRWKGLVLSYPREESEFDFTVKLYNRAKEEESVYFAVRAATWEAAPKDRFSGKTFTFRFVNEEGELEELHNVPIEFKPEFDEDPLTALAKYACRVIRAKSRFFESSEVIKNAMGPRLPILETQDVLVEDSDSGFKGIGKFIVKWNVSPRDLKVPRVIHIDLGRTRDSAAVMIAHGEPTEVQVYVRDADGKPMIDPATGEPLSRPELINKVVEDAHLVWKPDPKRGLKVSLRNVEEIVYEICKKLNVVAVSMDFWNSATLSELLSGLGVEVIERVVTRDDYLNLRTAVELGCVELLPSTLLVEELSALRDDGKRVDHPEGGSKDLADCLAGVYFLLNQTHVGLQIKKVAQPLVFKGAQAFAHPIPSNNFEFKTPFSYPVSVTGKGLRSTRAIVKGVSLPTRAGSGMGILGRFR